MASTPKKLVANLKAAQRRIEAAEQKRKIARKKTGIEIAKEKSVEKRKATKVAQTATQGLSARFLIRETPARTHELMRADKITVTSMRRSKSGKVLMSKTSTSKKSGIFAYAQIIKNNDPDNEKFGKAKYLTVDCNCLAGSTRVLTANGWKTLFELAEPYSGDFSVDYVVNGKVYKGTAPYYKGKKKAYKITLSTGEEIIATKSHKFLKYNSICKTTTTYADLITGRRRGVYERKETKKWIPLKDLEVGDKICLTNDKNIYSVDYTDKFYEAFFIGIIMGDGSVFKKGTPDLKLYGDKKELLDILVDMDIVGSTSPVKGRDAIQVIFTNRGRELLSKYKYVNKQSIHISSREELYGYISGLANTDGSMKRALCIDGGEAYLSQLKDYLIQYGIVEINLSLSRKTGTETNSIDGLHTLKATKDMYRLYIKPKALTKMNLLMVGKRKEKMQIVIDKCVKSSIHKTPYTTITSITYNGANWVYDITVPKKECFTIDGGVLAHNCGAFKFRNDWALNEKGASDLKHSIDAPPDITNPVVGGKRNLGVCKHALRVLQDVVNKNY